MAAPCSTSIRKRRFVAIDTNSNLPNKAVSGRQLSIERSRLSSLLQPGHCLRLQPLQQLPQHGLQDSAVAIVVHLDRRIDAHEGRKCLHGAVGGLALDLDRAARLQAIVEVGNVEQLLAGQAERLPGLARR